jgi:hypothetical protein
MSAGREHTNQLRQAFVDGTNWQCQRQHHGAALGLVCDEAARRFPYPTVEVPRVVRDDEGIHWKVDGNCLSWSYDGQSWGGVGFDNTTRRIGQYITVDRVRLIADILANPTETREATE